MKINVTQQFHEIDGTPATVGEEKNPFMLRKVLVESLLLTYNDEAHLPGEEKVKRYELAVKIQREDEPELKIEDIALVKKLVGKAYAPIIVGQAWSMLEGQGVPSGGA